MNPNVKVKSIQLKNFILILIQLSFTYWITYMLLSSNQAERETFLYGHWGLSSMIFFAWALFTWLSMTRRLISYYTVFLGVATLFHFGQAWVDFLAPDALSYNALTEFYSTQKVSVGYFYAFVCIAAFHSGALISGFMGRHIQKKKHLQRKPKKIRNIEGKYDYLLSFALVLLIISFLCRIQVDIKFFLAVRQGGYLSIFDSSMQGGYWGLMLMISAYYYPAIYVLLFCFRKRKFYFNLVFYLSILHSMAFGVLIGNRGNAFMFIVAVILYRHIIYKKYTKKEILTLAAFALLILSMSSIIALTRIEAKQNLSLQQMIKQIQGYNLIYSSIAEFGGTLMTLLVAMRYIPTPYMHGYGISYLASTVVILPDVFHWFDGLLPYISVSGALTQLHAGLGGSFIAEAYYNFGDYGFLFMILLGIVVGRFCYTLDHISDDRKNALSAVWMSLLYFSLLMYIRDQFYSITTGLLQYMIYPLILYLVFRQVCYLIFKTKLKRGGA